MIASKKKAKKIGSLFIGLASLSALCAQSLAQSNSSLPNNDEALKLIPSYNEKTNKNNWDGGEAIVSSANKIAQSVAMAGLVLDDGRDTYRTALGGDIYYITANSYNVMSKADLNAVTETSTKMYPGNCAFYLYDKDMQLASSHIVRVGNGALDTHCNSIYGVSGVSFRGKPALLAVVQYFYTNAPIAKSVALIGNDWIRTTVLMPLIKKADGKWVFAQDTACFTPTNTIETLAGAKEHLKNCH
jgi:hypothetical protein